MRETVLATFASAQRVRALLRIYQVYVVVIAISVASQTAWCHPGAINLYVTAGGSLAPLPGFDPGGFVLYPGIELSSIIPSIAVSFPANGVTAGERLELEVAQGLLFWNGSSVVPTPRSIQIQAPLFDIEGFPIAGNKQVYNISANSRVQRGMTWGTYSGHNFWEADGLFFLDSLAASPGIYGLVYRVTSSSHLASEPFLAPLVYDPTNAWSISQEDAGIAALRAFVRPQTGDYDRDGDYDCNDIDLLTHAVISGSNPIGFDLNGDALVNPSDLAEWLVNAGSASLTSGGAYRPGDANLDGVVDGSDFGLWNAHKFTASDSFCLGDFNTDGVIDGSDFGLWNANKFTSSDGNRGSLVPEPNMAIGLGLILVCRAVQRIRQSE